MRAARWIAGVFAGLVLLCVVLVIVVTFIIDPNRFRGRIEGLVSEASGQPFHIQGDLDLAWYPWLALKMGAARLGGTPALIEWQSASVGARLIPLIRGQLVVSRVRLEGLRIHLERDAAGRGNWESLLARQSGSKSGGSAQIGGLEIRNARLEYVDAKRGTRLALEDWRLDLGEWKPDEPVSLSTKFNLQRLPAQPLVPVAIDLPRIRLRTTPLTASIPKFGLEIASASITGKAELESTAPLRAQGELSLQTGSLRALLAALAVGGPRPLDGEALGTLKLHTRWALHGGAFAAKPIRMQLDETTYEGEVTRAAGADSITRFELRGDRIALDRYVRLEDTDSEPFELPTAALKALRVDGALTFTEARIAGAEVKNARIRLETPR